MMKKILLLLSLVIFLVNMPCIGSDLLSKTTTINVKDIQNLIKEYARDFSEKKIIKLDLANDEVRFGCLSPNGKLLATLSEYRRTETDVEGREYVTNSPGINLYIWDADTGKYLYQIGFAIDKIISMAFSPCSNFLAACYVGERTFRSNLPYINIYDLNAYFRSDPIKTYYDKDGIDKIVYSPNGNFIAFGQNKDIKIWDINTANTVQHLKDAKDKSDNFISYISYSPDGKSITSLHESPRSHRNIKIWDVASSKCINVINDISNDQDLSESRSNLLVDYSDCGKFIVVKVIFKEEWAGPGASSKYYIFDANTSKLIAKDNKNINSIQDKYIFRISHETVNKTSWLLDTIVIKFGNIQVAFNLLDS